MKKTILLLCILVNLSCFSTPNKSSNKNSSDTKVCNTSQGDKFIPKNSDSNKTVSYKRYKLSFSEKHKQAEWVYYMLTKEMLEKKFKRGDEFRTDTNVRNCATLEDYRNSGYDRGHLTTASHMTFNDTALSQTFFLTNISPQIHDFNAKKWASLEDKFAQWAVKYDTIFVITAGIINGELIEKIGSGVSVPKHFYKIALVYKNNQKKAIAFKMENTKLKGDLSLYSTTVRDIEELTGIDFFYLLDKSEQDLLENQNDYKSW